jgi:hypothetical protein
VSLQRSRCDQMFGRVPSTARLSDSEQLYQLTTAQPAWLALIASPQARLADASDKIVFRSVAACSGLEMTCLD